MAQKGAVEPLMNEGICWLLKGKCSFCRNCSGYTALKYMYFQIIKQGLILKLAENNKLKRHNC
jgi:hypothetical protein